MHPATAGKLYDYGVRPAPFLVKGKRALMAVDAFGEIQKVRRLHPGDDIDAIGERLWEWLIEHHPQRPELALVRDETTSPAPPPTAGLVKYNGRWIDPRLLSDPRSPLAKRAHNTRLVQAAAKKGSALMFRREP